MINLQRMGGLAALYEAVAYILGFWLYFGVLDSTGYEGPVRQVAFLAETQDMQTLASLLVYVAFSVFLVVLVFALHERLKQGAPAVMQTASAFGVIWAGLVVASGMIFNVGMNTAVGLYTENPEQAATVWIAISAIQEGIGGGVEIVGGLWLLSLSVGALMQAKLPKLLNYLGVLVGGAGILTVLPPLSEIGAAVFGLGQIVWFIWVGIMLLQQEKQPA